MQSARGPQSAKRSGSSTCQGEASRTLRRERARDRRRCPRFVWGLLVGVLVVVSFSLRGPDWLEAQAEGGWARRYVAVIEGDDGPWLSVLWLRPTGGATVTAVDGDVGPYMPASGEFLVKLSADGSVEWARSVLSDEVEGYFQAAAEAGGVTVVGGYLSDAAGWGFALYTVDGAGNLTPVGRYVHSAWAFRCTEVRALQPGHGGYLVLVGELVGGDRCVLNVAADGSIRWSFTSWDPGAGDDVTIEAIAVAPGGFLLAGDWLNSYWRGDRYPALALFPPAAPEDGSPVLPVWSRYYGPAYDPESGLHDPDNVNELVQDGFVAVTVSGGRVIAATGRGDLYAIGLDDGYVIEAKRLRIAGERVSVSSASTTRDGTILLHLGRYVVEVGPDLTIVGAWETAAPGAEVRSLAADSEGIPVVGVTLREPSDGGVMAASAVLGSEAPPDSVLVRGPVFEPPLLVSTSPAAIELERLPSPWPQSEDDLLGPTDFMVDFDRTSWTPARAALSVEVEDPVVRGMPWDHRLLEVRFYSPRLQDSYRVHSDAFGVSCSRSEDRCWATKPKDTAGFLELEPLAPDVPGAVLQCGDETAGPNEPVFLPLASDVLCLVRPATVVTGRVLQRHAGALPSDPDGDGVVPVPLAQVGTDPDFGPDGNWTLTDGDGRFRLEDVGCGDTVTVYVRLLAPGDPYGHTQSLWSGSVPCDGSWEVEVGDIYLASTRAARSMLESRLPRLERLLTGEAGTPTIGTEQHRSFAQGLLRRVAPSSDFGPTLDWEEEALRRLALAEWVAAEGTETMSVMAQCGVRYLWDASFAVFQGLFNKMVDAYLQTLLKKAERLWEVRFLGDMLPGEERAAIEREIARLNGVEKAIVDAVARWHEQLFIAQRSLLGSGSEVIDLMMRGFWVYDDYMFHLDLNKWQALTMAARALSEYDVVKALYDWAKGVDQAIGTATDWPTVVTTINQLRDQLISPITGLLDGFRASIEDLAQGGIRSQVDGWLLQTAAWAGSGDFVQAPDSFRQASQRVAGYAQRLSQLWGELSLLCANMESFYTIVYETAGAVQVAAVLSSLITGGSSTAVAAAMEAVQWGTLATKALTGLAFIGLAQPEGEAGILTRRGMYEAFDKLALAQEQEQQEEAIQVIALSPVHLMAVDRLGRQVGLDAQGVGSNDVPGASFVRPQEGVSLPDVEGGATTAEVHEALVLPLEHAPYTLLVWGTGSGPYTLRVMRGGRIVQEVTGTASPGVLEVATLTVTDAGSVQLGAPQAAGALPVQGLVLYGPEGRIGGSVSLEAGERVLLRAYLELEGGLLLPVEDVSWESSDGAVAVLEPQGGGLAFLEAGRAGRATVTAWAGGRTATLAVQVSAGAPSQVVVEVLPPAPVRAGEQACLRARVLDGGGNGLPGVRVRFTAFGEEAPVGEALTREDGRTEEVCFPVPATAAGPEPVVVRAGEGDEASLPGWAILPVLPASGEGQVTPEGGTVEIWHGGELVGYVEVPAGAFAGASAPLVSGSVLGEGVELPAAPEGMDLVRAVAVSTLDLATGDPLRPSEAMQLVLFGPGGELRAAVLLEGRWQPLDGMASEGAVSSSIESPGVYALLRSSTSSSTPTPTPTPMPSPSPTPTPGPASTPTPTPTPSPTSTPVGEVRVASPTGTGEVRFRVVSSPEPGSFRVESVTAGSGSVPAGYRLPHGMYAVTASGLPPGASITVEVTLPEAAGPGVVWLKATGGTWSVLPVGSDDGDPVVSVVLTDGGPGDADGVANGSIVGPGGPATYTTYQYVLWPRWSLVAWWGVDGVTPREALAGSGLNDGGNDVWSRVSAIYHWDAREQRWRGFFPGVSVPGANLLGELRRGEAYWVAVAGGRSVVWEVVGEPPGAAAVETYTLRPGWNAVVWRGRDGVEVSEALGGVAEAVTAVYWWDGEGQRWRAAFPSSGVAYVNDLSQLRRGEVYWFAVRAGPERSWIVPGGP